MLAFIHIPKCAGQTVHSILRSTYGVRHCDVEPVTGCSPDAIIDLADLRFVRMFYPRLGSIAGHHIRPYGDLDAGAFGVQYFTMLRSPLVRTASHFQYRYGKLGKRDLGFSGWIELEWSRNCQTKMIAGVADAEKAMAIIEDKGIAVGLTEQFEESMLVFSDVLATDLNIAIPPRNRSTCNVLAEGLLACPETRGRLMEANQEDLRLYAYVRDQLFPGTRANAKRKRKLTGRRQQVSPRRLNRANLVRSFLRRNLVYKPALRCHRLLRGSKVWGC